MYSLAAKWGMLNVLLMANKRQRRRTEGHARRRRLSSTPLNLKRRSDFSTPRLLHGSEFCTKIVRHVQSWDCCQKNYV